jgi:MYXO-CTERM domain-containing protein
MAHLRSTLLASLAAAAATGVAVSASGQIAQPDGTLVPDQNTSGDYFDTSRYNVNTLGLGTMLDTLEDGLVDYRADAATEPSVFSPLCGLTGSMIMRGGSCNMDFGWYCVDHPPTSNTDPNFVPLVTAAEVRAYHDALTGTYEQYKNDDKGFVPLIGMPPVEGAPLEGVREHPVFQIENCPSQKIGFAIMPTGIAISSVGEAVCDQAKFSESRLNPTHSSGQPWISALVYASQTRPGVFYLAFEDLPSSATSFVDYSLVPSEWSQDSDFNDFVYMVEGIQCDGGGLICPTGLPGKCGIGVTECTVDGTEGACTPRFSPETEECNNIDDDCDGVIDGEGLCPVEAPHCFEGSCVADCGGGEFPCPGGYECDPTSLLCVATGCLGVICGADQVCRNGICVGGCEGVSCPSGQDCISGECIDLCAGQNCPAGFVCEKGACIADCNCLPCAAGKDCGADGKCIDTACLGVECPAGQACNAGVCSDPCIDRTCPGGQICQVLDNKGVCVDDPAAGSGGTDGSGGGLSIDSTGGNDPTLGSGGGNVGNPPMAPESDSGCGCRAATGRGAGSAAAASLLLLGLAFARRRRHR